MIVAHEPRLFPTGRRLVQSPSLLGSFYFPRGLTNYLRGGFELTFSRAGFVKSLKAAQCPFALRAWPT